MLLIYSRCWRYRRFHIHSDPLMSFGFPFDWISGMSLLPFFLTWVWEWKGDIKQLWLIKIYYSVIIFLSSEFFLSVEWANSAGIKQSFKIINGCLKPYHWVVLLPECWQTVARRPNVAPQPVFLHSRELRVTGYSGCLLGDWQKEKEACTTLTWPATPKIFTPLGRRQRERVPDPCPKPLISIWLGIYILLYIFLKYWITSLRYCLYIIFILNMFVCLLWTGEALGLPLR